MTNSLLSRRALAIALAAVPTLAAAPSARAGDRPIGPAFAGRSATHAPRGMVATSQPLATQAGLQVLRAGGSAVDAAIAANACLGLMEPTGCGIGGDLFALVWDPKAGALLALNASGPAPRGESLAQLTRRIGAGARVIPGFGPIPQTVPGAVGGWLALHERFGARPLSEALAPAIGYAEEGHPVAPVIASGWAANFRRFAAERAAIGDLGPIERIYAPGGAPPKAGETFRNPALARTYRAIAAGGRGWFYEGEGAAAIDRRMRAVGAALRASDLAAYRAEWVAPITTTYRGVTVAQCPPNGQGLTVLQLLNLLEGFDLKAMGFGSADHLHVCAEAKKIAFADRARHIADPRFAELPLEMLLSKEYAAKRRGEIAMDRARPAAQAQPYEEGDTIYLSAADASGMMVSLIQSNYRGMGSGVVIEELGFMMQNRGSQFSLDPRSANAYRPGKRPFHTIIPGFALKDGAPWLAFGVMGGDMQPQGHAQIISNLVDFGFDPQEAGDAPRWRHIGGPDADGSVAEDRLYLERGFEAARPALAARGHTFATGYQDVGGYQAVQRAPGGGYVGASEMRKDGQAAGF